MCLTFLNYRRLCRLTGGHTCLYLQYYVDKALSWTSDHNKLLPQGIDVAR